MNCLARGMGPSEMLYILCKGQTWYLVGTDHQGRCSRATLPERVYPRDVIHYLAGPVRRLRRPQPRVARRRPGEHRHRRPPHDGDDLRRAVGRVLAVPVRRRARRVPRRPGEVALRAGAPRRRRRVRAGRSPSTCRRSSPRSSCPARSRGTPKGAREVADDRSRSTRRSSARAPTGGCQRLRRRRRDPRGPQVAPGTRMIVTPGSQDILKEAIRAGYVETLMDAGAVVTSSTCGACFGGHMGLLADERGLHHRVDPQLQGPDGKPGRRASTWARRRRWPPRRSPASSPTRGTSDGSDLQGKVWKFDHDINTDLVIPNFAVLMPVGGAARSTASRPTARVGSTRCSRATSWWPAATSASARPATSAPCSAASASAASSPSRSTASGLRNCINAGLPSLPCAGVLDAVRRRATSPRSTGSPERCAT